MSILGELGSQKKKPKNFGYLSLSGKLTQGKFLLLKNQNLSMHVWKAFFLNFGKKNPKKWHGFLSKSSTFRCFTNLIGEKDEKQFYRFKT
jgi:hypothetical protein